MMHACWRWGFIALALAATREVRAAGAFRYDWLTSTNLVSPSKLVEASLQALPKTIKQKQDWLARMHKAAWVPTLDLRYTIGEAISRDYRVVDRISTTTGSESQRGSESSTSIRDASSSSVGSDAVLDGLGAPQSSSTKSDRGTSTEKESQKGSNSSQTSFKSTTYSGPESYATGEDTRWVNEFGLYLSWDLSRVLFREEEISVVGAELDRETFRQSVKEQVITAYYDLVEALMLLDNETYKASIPTQVKRERMAFLLDSLTDGALSNAGGHEAP